MTINLEKPEALTPESLKADVEQAFAAFAAGLSQVYTRLEQVERLISLRLKMPLAAIPGKKGAARAADEAEFLAGIREGLQIETVLLDMAQRLAALELSNQTTPLAEVGADEHTEPSPEG